MGESQRPSRRPPAPPPLKKTAVRIALSLGIAAVLLGLLMAFADVPPAEVWATLRGLPAWAYFLALGVHFGLYVMRAVRFQLLLPRASRPGFGRVMVLSAAHNLASYVLPAKTGEASWPMYLRSHCGVRTSTGLASLVVARMLDGAVLCLWLACACLWIGLSGKYDHLDELGTIGGTLGVLFVTFGFLAVRGDFLFRFVTFGLRFIRVHHWTVGERFLAKLYEVAVAMRDAAAGKRLGAAALLSVPVWGGVFLFYYVLGREMGLPRETSYPEVVFGSSIAVMANLLPVNGFAGTGTQEGGWLAGFHFLLGIDKDVALASSIGAHVVQLFNVVSMGLIAHVAMGMLPRVQLGGEPAVPETLATQD